MLSEYFNGKELNKGINRSSHDAMVSAKLSFESNVLCSVLLMRKSLRLASDECPLTGVVIG
jgi:hypothetical protein